MVVMMFLTTLAFAQNANLQVNRIMDGKIVPLDRMVVTKVRGGRSADTSSATTVARFEATAAERGLCAHAVDADKGGGRRGKCREPGKRKPARDFSGEGPRGLRLRGDGGIPPPSFFSSFFYLLRTLRPWVTTMPR